MPGKTRLSMIWSLILILTLSACGGAAEDLPTAPTAEDLAAAQSSPELSSADSLAGEEGTDLAGLDACQQIPVGEVSAIVGPLREDDTSQNVSIAGEAGCTYYDQDGQFYDLSYEPLYSWGTVEYALNEAQPMESLLDGAWLGVYEGGEITVKALVEGELVIGVHLSTGDLDTARALAELAYQHRP